MPTPPQTDRLDFARFEAADAEGLARVLSDPEVTRNITADASSPARALDCARRRIVWHNGALGDRRLRCLGAAAEWARPR